MIGILSEYFLQYTQNSSYTTLESSYSTRINLKQKEIDIYFVYQPSLPVEETEKEIQTKEQQKVWPDLFEKWPLPYK